MNVHCLFLYTSKIICSAWCSCWPVTFWFHSSVAPVAGQQFNTHLGKILQMSLISSNHLIKSFLSKGIYLPPSFTVSVLQWEIIVMFCVPNQSHCWGYRTFPHFEMRWSLDDFATLFEDSNVFFCGFIKYLVKEATSRVFFFCDFRFSSVMLKIRMGAVACWILLKSKTWCSQGS